MSTITAEHFKYMARMASLRFHEAFINRATKDRYVLPEEICDQCLDSIKRLILHSDDPLKERYLNLYVYCVQEADKAPDAFYGSPQWVNIRAAVQNFLSGLTDFDLTAWEKNVLSDA